VRISELSPSQLATWDVNFKLEMSGGDAAIVYYVKLLLLRATISWLSTCTRVGIKVKKVV